MKCLDDLGWLDSKLADDIFETGEISSYYVEKLYLLQTSVLHQAVDWSVGKVEIMFCHWAALAFTAWAREKRQFQRKEEWLDRPSLWPHTTDFIVCYDK